MSKSNKQSPESCRDNVYARYEALQYALSNLNLVPIEILDACESQSSLAALAFTQYGITPLARNSMYKYADQVLAEHKIPEGEKKAGENGQHYLDWLRKHVREKALKEIGYRTKAARIQRNKQHKQKSQHNQQQAEEHSLRVSKAYLHLLTQIKGMQADDSLELLFRKKLINIVQDHDQLYGDLFDEVGTVRPDNLEPLTR